jgi:hypothetical protein
MLLGFGLKMRLLLGAEMYNRTEKRRNEVERERLIEYTYSIIHRLKYVACHMSFISPYAMTLI